MIEAAFERRAEFNPATAPVALCEAVQEALDLLELGKARVAEPCNEGDGTGLNGRHCMRLNRSNARIAPELGTSPTVVQRTTERRRRCHRPPAGTPRVFIGGG